MYSRQLSIGKKALFLIIAIFLLPVLSGRAGDDYFSFERFDKPYDVSSLPFLARKLRFRLDHVEISLSEFSRALRLIKEERFSKAVGLLKHSLKRWPEFLPAHFVLAGVYEVMGDEKNAVDHYKTYLTLLRRLEQNKLEITGALLSVTGFDRFERYDEARSLIGEHLRAFGIDETLNRIVATYERSTALDIIFKNPSIVSFLGLLIVATAVVAIFGEDMLSDQVRRIFLGGAISLLFVFIFWLLFKFTAHRFWLLLAYAVYPVVCAAYAGTHIYKTHLLKYRTPESGHWICAACGAENQNIFNACQECSCPKPT